MDLTSKKNIEGLLSSHSAHLQRGLGQNFLVNNQVLEKILKAADLKYSDVVLEVGPGIGTLTQELAKEAKRVVAVEKDGKMVEILGETLSGLKNTEVVHDDILKIQVSSFKFQGYKVVANLPYYIVSPAIRMFLESGNPPKEMVLMVQKEVAQRICAKPPRMNLLAVSVQFYADPKIVSYVSKNSFWPRPKVDSAIIKIVPRQNSISQEFRNKFFRVARAGFSHPRKILLNNLSKGLGLNISKTKGWLLNNDLEPHKRAQQLTIEDWRCLTRNFPE